MEDLSKVSKEREQMEEEEKGATPLELLGEVRWVFEHPILAQWVREAPSVKSIDNHISNLFEGFEHRMELLKAMRKAVTVWQEFHKYKGARKKFLKKPEGWRLDDMFIFGNISELLGESRSERLEFATRINFLPDKEKVADCSLWPLLLKEFCTRRVNGIRSSVGNIGGAKGFRSTNSEIEEDFWRDQTAQALNLRRDGFSLDDRNYELSFKQDNDLIKENNNNPMVVAWADILFEYFGISTQVIRVAPGPTEKYSRFYKTVQLRDQRHGDVVHSVRVYWPIDCVQSTTEGKLTFCKSIKLHNDLRMTLKVEFKFCGNQFLLIPLPEHTSGEPYNYIGFQAVNSVQPELLFQQKCPMPEGKRVTEAMETLYGDFRKIWKHCIRQPISLESILGEEILRNPPECLLDLFTGV